LSAEISLFAARRSRFGSTDDCVDRIGERLVFRTFRLVPAVVKAAAEQERLLRWVDSRKVRRDKLAIDDDARVIVTNIARPHLVMLLLLIGTHGRVSWNRGPEPEQDATG